MADWLTGRAEAVRRLSALRPAGLAISLVTYGEIYEGIYFSRDPAKSAAVFRKFTRGVAIVPLTRRTMECLARIRGQLRERGQLISDPDLLIAATALQRTLTLVTRDVDHFERIPDLKLYSGE